MPEITTAQTAEAGDEGTRVVPRLRNLRLRLESALANRTEEGDAEAVSWLSDGLDALRSGIDRAGMANVMEELWRDSEAECERLASGLRPSDTAIAEAFHQHRMERESSLPPWSEVQEGSGIWQYSHNFAARLASLPVAEPTAEQLRAHGYAPGGYIATCQDCGEKPWDLDKRATRCKPCATAAFTRTLAAAPAAPPADGGAAGDAAGDAAGGAAGDWAKAARETSSHQRDHVRDAAASMVRGSKSAAVDGGLEELRRLSEAATDDDQRQKRAKLCGYDECRRDGWCLNWHALHACPVHTEAKRRFIEDGAANYIREAVAPQTEAK